MAETDFKASVEISRKWDGEEVAIEIVDKIKNKMSKPKFILLFTTICMYLVCIKLKKQIHVFVTD